MRVLCTGGTGFLGSHVCEQLAASGHEVRCLVRATSDTSFLRTLDVELCEGAIDAPETLVDAVRGADAIVHCAGAVKAKNRDGFFATNEGGTRHLAEAAIAHAPALRRFVHVSTAGVMGPSRPGRPHRRTDPPNPATDYAESKLAAERALERLSDRLPVTILRPPAIYGPRDREILAFFKMVRQGLVFRLGDSLESNAMVFGPDCGEACVRALDADVPSGSAWFVDDGRIYSYRDMVEAIAAAYDTKVRFVASLPTPLVYLAAGCSELYGKLTDRAVIFTRNKCNELLMRDFVLDARDTYEALGWRPRVPFPEGARLTAAWYREHGWD